MEHLAKEQRAELMRRVKQLRWAHLRGKLTSDQRKRMYWYTLAEYGEPVVRPPFRLTSIDGDDTDYIIARC